MQHEEVTKDAFFGALQGLCTLHRKPFSPELAQQQFVAPYTTGSLLRAADAHGFDAGLRNCRTDKLHKESFPLIAWLAVKPAGTQATGVSDGDFTEVFDGQNTASALILQADGTKILIIEPSDPAPRTIATAELNLRYSGHISLVVPKANPGDDPDSEEQARQARKFGFGWFVPELLKHKRLWQEVLLASLVIQLIALASPLFTQAIIDKVVVHHTQSTLATTTVGAVVQPGTVIMTLVPKGEQLYADVNIKNEDVGFV